ncbi:MAG: cobyric acid synthase CobQ, partial [Paracoccaceae bacterium]
GIEGRPGSAPGLGVLDVRTVLEPAKTLALTEARALASGETVEGYEIHLGRTVGADCARAWLDLGDGRRDGAASPDGRVMGTYLHGLFASDGFRRAYLAGLGAAPSDRGYDDGVEAALDALAAHCETHLDLDRLFDLAGPV